MCLFSSNDLHTLTKIYNFPLILFIFLPPFFYLLWNFLYFYFLNLKLWEKFIKA